MEDSGDSDFECASSATQLSYLEAARRAFVATTLPVPIVPCEGELCLMSGRHLQEEAAQSSSSQDQGRRRSSSGDPTPGC
jgi:hypothetical protein